MNLLLCLLTGIFGSLIIYVKKWQGGQAWEWKKFTWTVVVGLVVGIIAQYTKVSPQQITTEWIETTVLTYGSIITMVQTVFQIIWNLIAKKNKTAPVSNTK